MGSKEAASESKGDTKLSVGEEDQRDVEGAEQRKRIEVCCGRGSKRAQRR